MEKKKKTFQDYGKEWLDTLVVAISVAMAFRAYFYEPFNIPTGSMQETLWGYHTCAGEEKGKWDSFPLSTLKWLFTGDKVVDYKAPASGMVRIMDRRDGFCDVQVGTDPTSFKLPTDACRELKGRYFKAGETIWKGTISSGDFIFVNRWLWNFRRPRNDEIVIFSTTGIKELPQGTHYIKRLKARPGETYRLEHPVEDRPEVVTMGDDEYFACGDNFNNSFDSRYWGNVPGRQIRGVASVVFWPFSRWRVIK